MRRLPDFHATRNMRLYRSLKTMQTIVIYKNAIRTSQETHHVSATERNRLMAFGETVAVCCENRMEHTYTLCGQSVPHRRHNTSPLQSPVG
jgi:hypothetical protein